MDSLKTDKEALEKISVVDRERIYLRDYFAGEELDAGVFDIQLNCATLSEKEIIQAIVLIARDKFNLSKL